MQTMDEDQSESKYPKGNVFLEQIPVTVISVEGDIREQNRNNAVLFLGNFLGGLYGVLTATYDLNVFLN